MKKIKNSDLNILNTISKHRTEIMGFSALWILVLHVWYPFLGGINKYLTLFESMVIGSGYTGVDIFLFLSGWGLYFSIKKRNIFQFYKSRLKRILIPIFLTAIIYAIVNRWSLYLFFYNFFGIGFYKESIYCWLWFFTAIETLYLLFPLYSFTFNKVKSKGLFVVFSILIWLCIVLILKNNIRKDLFVFINRIPIFIIGIYIGYLNSKNFKMNYDKKILVILLLVLIFGFYEMHLCHDYGHYILVPYSSNFIPTLLITLSIIPLIALFFEKHNKIKNSFSLVGKMSLELYCLQEITNLLLRDFLDRYIKIIPIQNIIVILTIILTSYLFYLICNRLSKVIFK